jgi:hypothetical protein
MSYTLLTPFSAWIREWITWDTHSVRRSTVLRAFVQDGLIPFARSKGYSWATNDAQRIANALATGLWLNQEKSCLDSDWRGLELVDNTRHVADRHHFYMILDTDAWDDFWDVWGGWTDVNPEDSFRAQDRRNDIQEFLWGQLDLSLSAQTKVVKELTGNFDQDGDSDDGREPTAAYRAGPQDTYLREATESGQYEGRRR